MAEHVGSSESSGHYTAHTLRQGNWYKFDDEYFKQVSEKEALSREAYLLFYSRVWKTINKYINYRLLLLLIQ